MSSFRSIQVVNVRWFNATAWSVSYTHLGGESFYGSVRIVNGAKDPFAPLFAPEDQWASLDWLVQRFACLNDFRRSKLILEYREPLPASLKGVSEVPVYNEAVQAFRERAAKVFHVQYGEAPMPKDCLLYTSSSQRRAPSSGGGSFFAHVKSALSWTLGLGLGAALLVGLGVGGLQLHRMATTSEFFAIKRVEIRGTTHFSREEVLKAANLQSGVNSLTVNIADVEQGLRDNPWVLSVAVKRRLPDAFEIRIRERIPAFWMLKDGVLYLSLIHI